MVGDLLDTTVPDQVREAGAVMARLHDALAKYTHAEIERGLVAPSGALATQLTEWLETSDAHVPATARDALHRLVDSMSPDPLPTQLVHGDFRSANVLCVGAEVAAVIDFEEARLDHRIVELARSAVLLGTRFHHWGPASSEVRRSFLDGYESERPLTPLEARWWDVLVLWHSLAVIPPGDDPTGWEPAALSCLRELGEDA